MNKKILLSAGIGQFVLAVIFALAAWHFSDVYDESAELESRISSDLFRAEEHFFHFLTNLRDNAPGLRDVGTSLNNISGKRQWGTPMMKCAADIEKFSGSFLEKNNMIGDSGRFIESTRPVSRSCFMLMLICSGISLVFIINGVTLLLVRRDLHTPDDRS